VSTAFEIPVLTRLAPDQGQANVTLVAPQQAAPVSPSALSLGRGPAGRAPSVG